MMLPRHNATLACFFCLSIWAMSQVASGEEIDHKVANLIERCYDLAYSGLQDKAKGQLVAAIYDSAYSEHEAALRFALGELCYEDEYYDGARYQWDKILQRFPESNEADVIRIVYDLLEWSVGRTITDIKFGEEYNLSRLFWNPTLPDYRMQEEIKDPVMALEYLKHLYHRYPDGAKRSIILYDQFLLLMGYNNNNFGFHNVRWDYSKRKMTPSVEYYRKKEKEKLPREPGRTLKVFFLKEARAISDSLLLIPAGHRYYVKTQFLLAASVSGTKIFSSKIKIKKASKQYLENIVAFTEGDETNIYRLFAMVWLSRLRD